MKFLVVGLGIGQLYVDSAKQLNWEIETVDIDSSKNATYTEIPTDKQYDLGIVCTPNYLHKETLDKLLPVCNQVLVEKPGLKTKDEWEHYTKTFPGRVFMVKNNCFRQLFYAIGLNLANIANIELNWINSDRVPKPGSWFTNKELAFGGVSRDLLPHLLHAAIALVRYDVDKLKFVAGAHRQSYKLSDITSSSYGEKIENGVYNVDDTAWVALMYDNQLLITCNTAWKSELPESIEWIVNMHDGTSIKYDAGLCPNEAYITMLQSFEQGQHADNIAIHEKMDLFVHDTIDKLENTNENEIIA